VDPKKLPVKAPSRAKYKPVTHAIFVYEPEPDHLT
jgi:hypothetical protein